MRTLTKHILFKIKLEINLQYWSHKVINDIVAEPVYDILTFYNLLTKWHYYVY